MPRNEIRIRLFVKDHGKVYEYQRIASNFKDLDSLIELIKKEHWDLI